MQRRTFFRSTAVAAAALSFPDRHSFAELYRAADQQPQDLAAVTGDGKQITLSSKAIADLRARLRGRVLLSADPGYDDARRILNPSFDKRPALIAQVTGAADVRAAVDFARENQGLLTAVKCGGHSFSGQSTCDRGLMVDLSGMRNVRVDPVARRAVVTGGSLLGHVDHEAMAYGLVTPLGTVSHTGVGGLVTGGGFGRLARRFGLAIDNLVAVDVVTADGQLRHASKDVNPDLFWGVRGGGGNFGIVTSFEFRLHPMQRQVIAGSIRYPIARAQEVLSLYADYAPTAPDELQLDVALLKPPGDAPGMASFGVCYSGPASRAEAVLAPLRKLGTPLADDVGAKDYVAVQKSGDISDPRAMAMYLKSGFVPQIPAALLKAMVDGFRGDPTRYTQIVFVQSAGAISRVGTETTAFSQRSAQANMLGIVGWPNGSESAQHVAYIKQYWAALEPFTHGFYTNDLDMTSLKASDVTDNFGRNYDRLVATKTKYDPRNLFRLNANVKPTV
ncbi:MAG: FAD-binding oxidoreductase [Gemmatimonadota bacterium]